MSPTTSLDELEPIKRRSLRALADGDGVGAIAADTDREPGEIATLVLEALVELAGDAEGIDEQDQLAIAAYLLGRQSPGEAAGTWEVLEHSQAATAWSRRLRDALADIGRHDPPPLPGDEDARSPTDRARRDGGASSGGQSLAQRRAARDQRRSTAAAQQAAAEVMSPFRSEALEAQKEADDRIDLPDFAPKPVRLATYLLLVVLLGGLAFAIFVRIPVNTTATVLVATVPDGAPGAGEQDGLALIAVFAPDPQSTTEPPDIAKGDELRVALPGQEQRSGVRLRWVSEGEVAPREIVDGYRLPTGQANLVRSPSVVGLAPIDPPEGRDAESYDGTTTTEASVQTGSQRIISLLF